MNPTEVPILALTGALLVVQSVHAASGGSGTATHEVLTHGSVVQPVMGGTTSGAGALGDGAARAEASEQAAGGISVPPDPGLVHPKSVQHQSTAQKSLCEGHTDWMGSDGYNQRLGERRQSTVRDYLVARGIASDRIEVRSFGESMPVASNEAEAGRALNPRVELITL